MNKSKIRGLFKEKVINIRNIDYTIGPIFNSKRANTYSNRGYRQWVDFVDGIEFTDKSSNRTVFQYKVKGDANSNDWEKYIIKLSNIELTLNGLVLESYLGFKSFLDDSRLGENEKKIISDFNGLKELFESKGFNVDISNTGCTLKTLISEKISIDFKPFLVKNGFGSDLEMSYNTLLQLRTINNSKDDTGIRFQINPLVNRYGGFEMSKSQFETYREIIKIYNEITVICLTFSEKNDLIFKVE